jgi:hypothetical protein
VTNVKIPHHSSLELAFARIDNINNGKITVMDYKEGCMFV